MRPREDVPVRLIVLDTVAPDPPLGLPMHYGVMTRDQFDSFLKPEVDAASNAEEFVIIVSHHPSSDFLIPYPTQTVTTFEFRRYLARQPNVIAQLCGHTHRHHVTWVPGRYPYVEIETAALITYPQEARLFDVCFNETTGSVRLVSTLVSHMEDPTHLSREAYRRAVIDMAYAPNAKAAASLIDARLFPQLVELYGPSGGAW